MTKREYMDELRVLLYDIPQVELDEAIEFYENYFADAGEENEEKVIESLGTPSHLAAMIRGNVFGTTDESKQEFTDSGYHDREFEERYDVEHKEGDYSRKEDYQSYGYYNNQNQEPYGKKYSKPSKWLLIALICIICLPVAGGLLAGIGGCILGLVVTGIAIGIAGVAGGVGLIIGGIVVLVIGIINLAGTPFSALFTSGVGCLLIGGGCLLFELGILVFHAVVPACYRAFIHLCQWIYSKIGGGARR